MSDLRELYQEVIFDHNRNPRNYGALEDANRKAEGFNPLCGDQLTVYMRVNDQGVIEKVSFEGQGCAISTASASIMTEELIGKTAQQAQKIFDSFHDVVTGGDSDEDIGKLEVLSGVKDYPTRVKCATLPWHTTNAAINQQDEPVTTE